MRSLLLMVVGVILAFAGCSGDATNPGPRIASATIQPDSVSLLPDSTAQLNAVLRDESGSPLSGRPVTWTSSDDDIAWVSAAGVVMGMTAGVAVITASSEGPSATAEVTVRVPAAQIVVSPPTAVLTAGDTLRLSASVQDADGKVLEGRDVQWSVDDASATVSPTGLVTALGKGSATITASREGVSGSASITVLAAVASVIITPDTVSIFRADTVRLAAEVRDEDGDVLSGRSIAWTAYNAYARVTQDGLVTGRIAGGTSTITATSEGVSGTAFVTVLESVEFVTVEPDSALLYPGDTAALTAVTRSRSGDTLSGRHVDWTSSDPGVATITPDGMVTAIGLGSTTITATAEGESGSAVITVGMPVASVVVRPSNIMVVAGGDRVLLTAILLDANGDTLQGRSIAWSSSDPGVAVPSTTGRVRGVVPGTAVITATSEGRSGTADATVVLPIASLVLEPDSVAIYEGGTAQLTPIVLDAEGNELTGRVVELMSSDESVASVSQDGLVTAQAPGMATITAVSEGNSATTAVTVLSRVEFTGADRVKVGDTYEYTARLYDTEGVEITLPQHWSIADPSMGDMDPGGVLVPATTGEIIVQVASGGEVWQMAVTAYDWEGRRLKSDNILTNSYGFSSYANLTVSCSTVAVLLDLDIYITSGAIQIAFDQGAPTSEQWHAPLSRFYLTPNLDADLEPIDTEDLVNRMAESRVFTLWFNASEQWPPGHLRTMSVRAAAIMRMYTFRVTGLDAVLAELGCAGYVP